MNGPKNIYQAAGENDVEALKGILASHSELAGTPDPSTGWSALHYAAEQNGAEAAELLLAHGADANAESPVGETPLHVVTGVEITRVILAHGGDPLRKDQLGSTPVERANQHSSREIAELFRLAIGDRCSGNSQ